MISPPVQLGSGRWPVAATLSLCCLTVLISLPVAETRAATPGKTSLCSANEKTWFEATFVGNAGAIAVCSLPDAGDPIGRIRVLQLTTSAAGSDKPLPVVIAEARGKARSSVFTIRRYTRPRTTYLKFELKNNRLKTVIYDSFEQGQTDTRMKEVPVDAKTEPRETVLRPQTEPLSLMGLEGVVQTLPFDE